MTRPRAIIVFKATFALWAVVVGWGLAPTESILADEADQAILAGKSSNLHPPLRCAIMTHTTGGPTCLSQRSPI